jgi:hypothetical protein
MLSWEKGGSTILPSDFSLTRMRKSGKSGIFKEAAIRLIYAVGHCIRCFLVKALPTLGLRRKEVATRLKKFTGFSHYVNSRVVAVKWVPNDFCVLPKM